MNDDDRDTETSREQPDGAAQLAFTLHEHLSRTLVLCPSYDGLEPHTAACIDWLRGLGAAVLHTTRCPDVALHRCLLATLAFRQLTTGQHANDREFILWIDSDVSISQEELAILFDEQLRLIEAFTDLPPSLSARYVGKVSDRIQGRLETTRDSIRFGPVWELQPALTGMGCLLMTRRAFMAHCWSSPKGQAPDGTEIYYVCSPGVRVHDTATEWLSEDWAFCLAHWNHCRGVYLSTARARHSRQILVMPTKDQWLIGPEETPLTEATGQLSVGPQNYS